MLPPWPWCVAQVLHDHEDQRAEAPPARARDRCASGRPACAAPSARRSASTGAALGDRARGGRGARLGVRPLRCSSDLDSRAVGRLGMRAPRTAAVCVAVAVAPVVSAIDAVSPRPAFVSRQHRPARRCPRSAGRTGPRASPARGSARGCRRRPRRAPATARRRAAPRPGSSGRARRSLACSIPACARSDLERPRVVGAAQPVAGAALAAQVCERALVDDAPASPRSPRGRTAPAPRAAGGWRAGP